MSADPTPTFRMGPTRPRDLFAVALVVFAGAAILYDTSNVVLHFPEDRYVGASLQLFSSLLLSFSLP